MPDAKVVESTKQLLPALAPNGKVIAISGVDPPSPFQSWCDWAKAGLADALEGMRKSGGGVTEYHIGSRGLHRAGPADQVKNIDYWNEMVKFFCGESLLPTSLTGRDNATRIILRDNV